MLRLVSDFFCPKTSTIAFRDIVTASWYVLHSPGWLAERQGHNQAVADGVGDDKTELSNRW